ncbi:MAG TPA: alpha/beta hydrolase [Ilumatobacteraceae bacterium]
MSESTVTTNPPPVTTSRTVAGSTIVSQRQGNGPPLVVLHRSIGLPGWLPVFDRLAQDHELIVPDLPGFGRSECPPWAREVRDMAIMLGMWLDAESIEAPAVVGLGFGGWMAAELATLAPLRLGSLVLVGAAGIVPREGRIFDQMLVSHTKYVQAHFSDPSTFASQFGETITDETLLAWEIHRETVARVTWKPYMYNRRLEALLPEVDVPSLIVWGDSDLVMPLECGRRYAEVLPRAELRVIANSGHAVEAEQPAELADLIRSHTRKVL